MSALVDHWPIRQPVVAGEDITCVVNLPPEIDVAATTWRAVIREFPEGAAKAAWTITPDTAGGANRLVLTLDATDSIALDASMGWDLMQLTPTERVIFTVRALNVIGPYSNRDT